MLQALSEKHNSFLRPLKKKGFKEERVTTIGLYDIGKSHDPGIQQEPPSFTEFLQNFYRIVMTGRAPPAMLLRSGTAGAHLAGLHRTLRRALLGKPRAPPSPREPARLQT